MKDNILVEGHFFLFIFMFILSFHRFSTCLCGLDNKACDIKGETIYMEKLDENEWTRNYFGNEYHCELSLEPAELISCKRMNTKATFAGCDTKEHYMCSAVLRASCPLFPSQSLTIYWTKQQTVAFTTWSQEVESVFSRVCDEKVPEKPQKPNESSSMTVVAWVLVAICVILAIVAIVLTIFVIIGRRRILQLSNPTNMPVDNGNNQSESNERTLVHPMHASTRIDNRKPLEHKNAFRLCQKREFILKDESQPTLRSSEACKQNVQMNKGEFQSIATFIFWLHSPLHTKKTLCDFCVGR